MNGEISAKGLITDVRTSLAFCTRLPLPGSGPREGSGLARASWALPVAGAVIGLLVGLLAWLAEGLDLPPFIVAMLVVGTALLITGCLHEDGLADTVDGFGGGTTRERKLEIMRDSHVGVFGTSALIIAIMLRAAAITDLAAPGLVIAGLLAAHAGSRAVLPAFMRLVPRARTDGLSAEAGSPSFESATVAALIGALAVFIGLGIQGGLIAILLVVAATWLMGRLALKQIGGQTGDVIGALQQVAEILILLTATVWL